MFVPNRSWMLSLALLTACSRGPSGQASSGTSESPAPPVTASVSSSASPAPPATAPPATAKAGVFAVACSAQCSDSLASVTTYRKNDGTIGVVAVQGSPNDCSHPPLRFFGADGEARSVIPFEPVMPGSAQAKRYDEIRTTETAGLIKAETFLCRDVKH